jgi:hypothetical protein
MVPTPARARQGVRIVRRHAAGVSGWDRRSSARSASILAQVPERAGETSAAAAGVGGCGPSSRRYRASHSDAASAQIALSLRPVACAAARIAASSARGIRKAEPPSLVFIAVSRAGRPAVGAGAAQCHPSPARAEPSPAGARSPPGRAARIPDSTSGMPYLSSTRDVHRIASSSNPVHHIERMFYSLASRAGYVQRCPQWEDVWVQRLLLSRAKTAHTV